MIQSIYRVENEPVPEIKQDVFSEFYSKTDFDTKFYGVLIRTDYADYVSSYDAYKSDVYFGWSKGSSTSQVPRFSLVYNGGVITDVTKQDMLITTLPTIQMYGYTWYYRYFMNSSTTYEGAYQSYYVGSYGSYRQQSYDSYEYLVRLILQPKN